MVDYTDDAAVAEAAGIPVHVVEGNPDNFKVTASADFKRAAAQLGVSGMRVGMGFDVHRFTSGDGVVLCGVEIPFERGLEGHSDADVALHAVTDALLGAIGAGDIGEHFPPDDAQWRDADSAIFLQKAARIVAERGARITNVDLTIIGEQPKIGPYRNAMRDSVAGLLELPADRVNIKATTTERLGFTGRREGLAAQAVVGLEMTG